MHHDVIRLTGGVTLREGTSTRSGPKLTSYGDKLTREAYLMRSGKMAPQPESEEEEEEDEGRDTGKKGRKMTVCGRRQESSCPTPRARPSPDVACRIQRPLHICGLVPPRGAFQSTPQM